MTRSDLERRDAGGRNIRGEFTCPKGHLSETYRLRVRVRVRIRVEIRVRVSVKFRNLHNYISDK